MVLESKLDRLADAFEARGIPVWSNLRSGVTEPELDDIAERLSVVLPEEFRELYRWRNGHVDPDASNVVTFRDGVFIGLDAIPQAYRDVNSVYGLSPADPEYVVDVDLSECVPIAEFMGSWLVVACGAQSAISGSQHPVFNAFHGVEPFFDSIDSMVETCIAWVEQSDYDPYSEAPNEREIWIAHNPLHFGKERHR